ARRGLRSVDVACPGFATDCLETLEEIGMMLAEQFAAQHGTLRAIPCLNDAPAHADAIAALASRQLRTGESGTLWTTPSSARSIDSAALLRSFWKVMIRLCSSPAIMLCFHPPARM